MPIDDKRQRKGSIFRTFKAVAWAFFGVRGNNEYQQDLGRLNPYHIIAVALTVVAAIVVGLIALVHWIVP